MAEKIEITPELLANLKAKAERATSGEWRDCFSRGRRNGWVIDEQNRDILKEVPKFRENVAFVAAANPAVVLALIEKIERLEEDFDTAARSAADESVKAVELEEEVGWLVRQASMMCNCIENCDECRLFSGCGCNGQNSKESWRKAAREAVEKENEAHKSAN